MSDVRAFVDTNIFVYLYSDVDDFKQKRAFFALHQYDCQISIQILNEFSNVCVRKWKVPTENILRSIETICS
jgi:predicted nucleic acid-binding protein